MGPQVAVGAVAVLDGALLLIQRKTEPGAGLWSLPGGRVEHGETNRPSLAQRRRQPDAAGRGVRGGKAKCRRFCDGAVFIRDGREVEARSVQADSDVGVRHKRVPQRL